VLQTTVDQLRGDLPGRYLAKMGSGGFRYLLENGVVYKNAHLRARSGEDEDVAGPQGGKDSLINRTEKENLQ